MRRKAIFDKSAWLLIAPAMLVLCFVDRALLETLLSWTSYAAIIAGITIVVSRIVFPQIELGTLICKSMEGSLAAAVVAGSLVVSFGLLFLSLVLWVKA